MEPKGAFSLLLLIGWIQLALCVEPLSGLYAFGMAVAAMGTASYKVVFCRFRECCDDRWIVNNVKGSSTLSNFHSSQGKRDRIHTCLLFLCFVHPKVVDKERDGVAIHYSSNSIILIILNIILNPTF